MPAVLPADTAQVFAYLQAVVSRQRLVVCEQRITETWRQPSSAIILRCRGGQNVVR